MFNDRLRRLLNDRKISQSELAEELKCTRQNVSDWLAGKSCPKYPNLIRLACFFGISIEDLLMDEITALGMIVPVETFEQSSDRPKDEQELLNIFRSLNTLDRVRLLTFAFELSGMAVETPNSSTESSLDWGKNKLKTIYYPLKPEEEKTKL